MFNYIVQFFDGFGMFLGEVTVHASSKHQAKIQASEIYFCPWVKLVAEPVL